MASTLQDSDPPNQVRVRLTTRDTDLTLNDAAPILVPTSFRRYPLSSLVNGLLENEKPVPLEFIVNGTYLRTTLDEYLSKNGLSTETTLAIEYVRARILLSISPLMSMKTGSVTWTSCHPNLPESCLRVTMDF